MRTTLSRRAPVAVLALAGWCPQGCEAAHEPKRVWIVQAVAYVELPTFTPTQYESTLPAFWRSTFQPRANCSSP